MAGYRTYLSFEQRTGNCRCSFQPRHAEKQQNPTPRVSSEGLTPSYPYNFLVQARDTNALKVWFEVFEVAEVQNTAEANPKGPSYREVRTERRRRQEASCRVIYSHIVVPEIQIPIFHPVSPTHRNGWGWETGSNSSELPSVPVRRQEATHCLAARITQSQ